MKILHLLYESMGDYFGMGGVGTRAYEIYGRLKDRHDITLLCKRYPGAEDREIEGLRHLFVGAESRSLTRTFLSYAFHAAGYVRQEGEKFDVIIEEFSPAIPTFLNFFRERPVVLQVQGYAGRLYFSITQFTLQPFFFWNICGRCSIPASYLSMKTPRKGSSSAVGSIRRLYQTG